MNDPQLSLPHDLPRVQCCSLDGVDEQQCSLGILACKSIQPILIPRSTKSYISKTDHMY